ncbi:hypothetical protein P389DRAFT_175451 [Cystobasidium minutum MCA 4210]|uniref:uncharacterized protein n=1 Tax=Cystobasidium minutum MCA 4210 TaxID=1397322 RepID=UPI0034CD3C9C|eukprot:jgi/Rhomi1/175451/fgenesh1_kg.10_\
MHSILAASAAGLAALVASCNAAALPHFLDPRAPHFAEIMEPQPDYVLRANASSNDTVAFQYRNGERAFDTTMTIELVNGNETYTLASNVTFYNSWYVNATLNIVYDQIPDGNYTLVAQEYLDGDVYSEVNQPFGISHDPNSPAPTGDMSSVDPDATPTSSAYILQPPSQQATTAPATTATASPDVDSASSSVERISLQLTRPAEGAAAHEHDGDGSIEENLHQFAKDLN